MKKHILLFLFVFLLVTTTSCTNNEGDDSLEVITPIDDKDAIKNEIKPVR